MHPDAQGISLYDFWYYYTSLKNNGLGAKMVIFIMEGLSFWKIAFCF